MTEITDIRSKRSKILEIASEYGVTNIRVFGSIVRGEANKNSDVDFLVNLEQGRDLFDLGGFQNDTQEFLGYKVDVVMENSIYHMLRDTIIKEAKPL